MTIEAEIQNKIVAIILAAGSSSRLGQPKQLLKIGHESLIRKTIHTVIDAGLKDIVVVSGAGDQGLKGEMVDLPVNLAFNPDWKNGMGSSLKLGVRFAVENLSATRAILVMVCDQPLLTAAHLRKIMSEFNSTHHPIIGSFYSGSAGVPALFHQSLFDKLLTIDDEEGAKRIIKENSDRTSLVEFPHGAIDLDTPEDLKNFFSLR